jgi:hypothetical protein
MGPTESDRQLIAKLRNMIDILSYERAKLYTRRTGCACDEKYLCALHAEVWSRLVEAADGLSLAIGKLESDG